MISYNYFPEKKFLLSIFYGEITSEEIHELIDKLQAIELDEGGMRGLTVICKKAKLKDLKAKEIMNFGQRMHNVNFRKNGKSAFITKTLLAYGLSRMYKVASDIFNLDEMKIYKENELVEAMNWLDVKEMQQDINNIINECEQYNQVS